MTFSEVQLGDTLIVNGSHFVAASQVIINTTPLSAAASKAFERHNLRSWNVSLSVATPSGNSGDLGCTSGRRRADCHQPSHCVNPLRDGVRLGGRKAPLVAEIDQPIRREHKIGMGRSMQAKDLLDLEGNASGREFAAMNFSG
jgi:hypothetical protein